MSIGITLLILGFISIALFLSSYYYYNYKRDYTIILNFENYIIVFDHFLMKSFSIIYKEDIFIYSIDAYTPSNKDELCKKFIMLFLKLIGPRLKKQFVYFFGSEEALLANVVTYFSTKFEDDQIRKAATEKSLNQI